MNNQLLINSEFKLKNYSHTIRGGMISIKDLPYLW